MRAVALGAVALWTILGADAAIGAENPTLFPSLTQQAANIRRFLEVTGPATTPGAELCSWAIANRPFSGTDAARPVLLGLRVSYDRAAALQLKSELLPLPASGSDTASVLLDASDTDPFAKLPKLEGLANVSVVPRCRIPLSSLPNQCERIPIPQQPRSDRPNDQLYDQLWGHALIGYHWKTARTTRPTQATPPVKVAVLDSGIDCRHPELADRFGPPTSGSICSRADGYDYAKMDHDAGHCDNAATCFAHGTAMAGIIAARNDNRIGVAGLAPYAQLMSYRILATDEDVGPIPNAEQAIRDAHRYGARILSMSVFGGPSLAPLCDDLKAVSSGAGASLVTVMNKWSMQYLAECRRIAPDVLHVAGVSRNPVDGTLSIANDSNGADFYAPDEFPWNTQAAHPDDYVRTDGSSNAVAYASGAAAQLWGTRAFASCDAHQIRRLLKETARAVTPCDLDSAMTIGVLDIAYLPQIARRKFASCDAAIEAAKEVQLRLRSSAANATNMSKASAASPHGIASTP